MTSRQIARKTSRRTAALNITKTHAECIYEHGEENGLAYTNKRKPEQRNTNISKEHVDVHDMPDNKLLRGIDNRLHGATGQKNAKIVDRTNQ